MIKATVRLNTTNNIPAVGFGTWKLQEGDEARNATLEALRAGYRLIDTASIYGNEKSVGRAIKESGVPREELFVTTKLWDDDQGYESAHKAFEGSLKRLGLEYVDLYLIHWPSPGRHKSLESWRAMSELYKDGRAKSIGVSNFNSAQLKDLVDSSEIIPAINQIPFNPFVYSRESSTLQTCKQLDVVVEAYSPLSRMMQEDEPVINDIAEKHNKTFAQVMLRWALQHNTVPIPKSAHTKRIKENLDIFDFELSGEDMERLNNLS